MNTYERLLTEIDRPYTRPTYGNPDIYDLNQSILRGLLRAIPDSDALNLKYYSLDYPEFKAVIPAIARHLSLLLNELMADDSHKNNVSLLALRFSLCPIHFCDYEFCFEIDGARCAQIRQAFPNYVSN